MTITALCEWLEGEVAAGDEAVQVWVDVARNVQSQIAMLDQEGIDGRARERRLVEQLEKFAHALSEIRGSLTALATDGIGEIEFAEEVQEALDGI